MRRTFLALVPLVTTAALFACEDDGSNGSTGTFNPEAGSFEASIPTANDAEPPRPNDAAADADAPKDVAVRILSAGRPLPNVRVVFHDTAGAVVGSVLTGADGRATSAGLAQVPTQASALLGSGSNFSVITWVAVEPGDELVATDTRVTRADIRQYQVSFPTVPNATGYYAATGGCDTSGGESPLTLSVSPECVRASTPILVRADGANGNNLGFAFKKGNAPPGDAGALAVTTGAFAAALTASVDATNLPNEEGNVEVGLTEIAEEVGFTMGPFLSLDGARTFRVPNGFADARQVVAFFNPFDNFGSQQTMVRRDAPQATNVLDFAQRLPKVTGAQVPTPADPRRFEITWTNESSLAAADGGVVRVRFFGGIDANFSWSFVVPPGAATTGSVKAPAMPAEGEGWIPQKADAGPTFFSGTEVMFVEASSLPSYAAFRRVAGSIFPSEVFGRRELSAVLPQNGTLRATSFEEQQAR